MFGRDRGHGLELNQDRAEANEIGDVRRSQALALIVQRKRRLGHEGDAPAGELQAQAFLVHSLKETRAHHPVDPEHGALDSEDLIPMKQVATFVWFVDHFFRIAALGI